MTGEGGPTTVGGGGGEKDAIFIKKMGTLLT